MRWDLLAAFAAGMIFAVAVRAVFIHYINRILNKNVKGSTKNEENSEKR